MTDVSYRYLVEVMVDGAILVHPEIPTELVEADRVATAPDIVSSSYKLAHDIDQQILVDRVSTTILSALTPAPAQETPDKVREALKERGITPEQGAEDPVN